MNDLPDTDSSEDNIKNDTYKGLSAAAIYLGEGTVLYLQMMKTLSILFFILSIINFPLYIIYLNYTDDNNYKTLELFQYFMVGNIAAPVEYCGFSHLLNSDSQKVYNEDRKAGELSAAEKLLSEKPFASSMASLELQCESNKYIDEFPSYGFIITVNTKYEKINTAEDQCSKVNDEDFNIEKKYTSDEQKQIYEEIKMKPIMHMEKTDYSLDPECNGESIFQTKDD